MNRRGSGVLPCLRTSPCSLFCAIFLCAALCYGTGEATSRELHLFDQAYNAYLSYRPEEAVKRFREFLREFPDSFAKDAALFWLARSLLHMKSLAEAQETFACLAEQFPDSPFIRHIPKDLETFDDAQRHEPTRNGAIDAKTGQRSAPADAIPITELGGGGQSSDDADGEHARAAAPEERDEGFPSASDGKNDAETSQYALQVGSFKTKDSALLLSERLRKRFPMQHITICQQGGFFKVRISGFKNRQEVDSILSKGLGALVVKTDPTACGSMSQSVVVSPR